MKVLLACFSFVVLLATCGISAACPTGQECTATEINVNSFGISARVMLVEGGRKRRADLVYVDAFYRAGGEWHTRGGISGGVGGFGWKADQMGKYKFVIKHDGFKAATLIVNVRSLRGRWNEFAVLLKADGCARVRLMRAGVK